MIIVFEILKGLVPGVYLTFLASAVAAAEFSLFRLTLKPVLPAGAFLFLISFSQLGMIVGFLVGFTPTPGTVSAVLPSVLTFVTGIFGIMIVKQSRDAERLIAAFMLIGFSVSMILFLFVGLRLRGL